MIIITIMIILIIQIHNNNGKYCYCGRGGESGLVRVRGGVLGSCGTANLVKSGLFVVHVIVIYCFCSFSFC